MRQSNLNNLRSSPLLAAFLRFCSHLLGDPIPSSRHLSSPPSRTRPPRHSAAIPGAGLQLGLCVRVCGHAHACLSVFLTLHQFPKPPPPLLLYDFLTF